MSTSERGDARGSPPASASPPSWLAAILKNTPLRRSAVITAHVALWIAALALALRLRFDGAVPAHYAQVARQTLLLLVAARLAAFAGLGLFRGLWRYSGFPELESIVVGTTLSSLLVVVLEGALFASTSPRSVYLGEWLASIVLVGGARMSMRSLVERLDRRRSAGGVTPTLIIGAGDAGESCLRDLQRMRDGAGWSVKGFLDDDRAKHGSTLRGVKVLGAADDASIQRRVRAEGIELVVLAMPTAPGWRVREILRACRQAGVAVKTVPSLADVIGAGASWSSIREIDIDDLLRREPVQLDVAQIEGLARGSVTLVTGAGGSIGSELCRQLLRFEPAALLLLDHDENALFALHRELRARGAAGKLVPLVADITDAVRVGQIFSRYRPALVLHAAAHKHVGMMELNVAEAVRNNVFGTRVVAEAAHKSGAGTFVLISTDKAVRPSSVMGCTKRVTEMIVQQCAQASETRYVAVRFGNVLGSAGSVVPIFREQIARGGPVTVTDPEVCRYFMTIPEAAQLVLQAAALGGNGQILMLDMGEPVKILDLARDLIELSGLRPGVDVEIEFTGLQPGEKLFEEILLSGESVERTPHPKIVVGRIEPVPARVLEAGLERLRQAAEDGDPRRLRSMLWWLVPESNLADEPDRPRLVDARELEREALRPPEGFLEDEEEAVQKPAAT